MNLFTAILAIGALQTAAIGQACDEPVNEQCDGAIEIFFVELPLQIVGELGCENNIVDRPYFDVFYRYDCTLSGNYRLDLCGSLGDTYMRVYSGGCGFFPASDWVEDDDSCSDPGNSLDPMIVTRFNSGVSYWIELGSWRDAPQFPPNANDPFTLNMAYEGICEADLNIDGTADLLDIELFLSYFSSADLRIDYTQDGRVNFFDVAVFLSILTSDCS